MMKNKIRLRYILSIILMIGYGLFAFSVPQAQKKQKVILYDDASLEIPDFKANFEVLRKNRVLYNEYNDSIFLIQEHDQWVNFFRRRALKNHQIFAGNQVALNNIFGYFKRDTVSAEAYPTLFYSFRDDYLIKDGDDPFLKFEVCKILQEFNRNCPDSYNTSNVVNLWMADAYVQMANLVKDSVFTKKAAECLKRGLSEEARNYPYYEKYYVSCLWNITAITFLQGKALTIQEHNHYFNMLKEWYRKNKESQLIPIGDMMKIRNQILLHDENILRNVYMVDSTVMKKEVADSMMRRIVEKNLANGNLSDLSNSRTLAMQVKLGMLSAKEAVKQSLVRYNEQWRTIKKKKLTSQELRAYLLPFYTFFYLNDISEESYAKKRRIVKRMCRDIETAYQHRLDQQKSTSYVRYLNTLTTYPRITKYLKPEERVKFLNTLNVATQVTTYAHSVHVSMIAEQVMKGVLRYQPELLVGCLGDLQVSEIKAHPKKYLDFIHDAAMYHDLGKNSIISVVNNDYRPLTDEEFAIIKTHPEQGLKFLELAPSLAKFHDTTLGHHKWYNGKGGYPASFDNTKSPKRILIDIVTLSDCLQAATERIGRNYKGDKTFDTVMAEFRRDAGTRYNPELVELIDSHSDLSNRLADLIEDGWIEIYYNIYSQYF